MSGENRFADEPDDDLYDRKVCPTALGGCGQQKSFKQFPKPPADTRICKACVRDLEKISEDLSAYDARSKTLLAESGRMMVEQAKREHLDLPAMSGVVSSLLKHFGGLEGYTRRYYQQVIEAEQDKPGSKTVLDAYRQIGAMIALANQQEVVRDEATLDNKELMEIVGAAARKSLKGQVDGTARRIETRDDEPEADE